MVATLEVHHHLHSPEWVQLQLVLNAPVDQLLHFLSVCAIITVLHQTNDDGVLCILHEFHRRLSCITIAGVQGEEQWGEDTPLGGTSAVGPGVECDAPQLALLPVKKLVIH